MLDAQREIIPGRLAGHVFRYRDEIPGTDIAAPETRSAPVKLRHVLQFGIARSARHSIGESGLDLTQERVGLHQRNVESFDYRDASHVAERFNDLNRWERTVADDIQQSDFYARVFANVIH